MRKITGKSGPAKTVKIPSIEESNSVHSAPFNVLNNEISVHYTCGCMRVRLGQTFAFLPCVGHEESMSSIPNSEIKPKEK